MNPVQDNNNAQEGPGFVIALLVITILALVGWVLWTGAWGKSFVPQQVPATPTHSEDGVNQPSGGWRIVR